MHSTATARGCSSRSRTRNHLHQQQAPAADGYHCTASLEQQSSPRAASSEIAVWIAACSSRECLGQVGSLLVGGPEPDSKPAPRLGLHPRRPADHQILLSNSDWPYAESGGCCTVPGRKKVSLLSPLVSVQQTRSEKSRVIVTLNH